MATCSCHGHQGHATETSRTAAAQTVGEVAGRSTRALEVLQRFGMNHCCGAGLTLAEASAAAGVDLGRLLAALSELPDELPDEPGSASGRG
jgi:iron-sulfur cluster repair protein YtfE (RIC family)